MGLEARNTYPLILQIKTQVQSCPGNAKASAANDEILSKPTSVSSFDVLRIGTRDSLVWMVNASDESSTMDRASKIRAMLLRYGAEY